MSNLKKIDPLGFREYDARWLFPESINEEGIDSVGKGFGTQVISKIKNPTVIVGHDYRSYSENVKKNFVKGFKEFLVKAMPLTILTAILFLISLFFPGSCHKKSLEGKPKISTLTEHLSKVLDSMSAQIAAIVIGLPLIDPELSISKVTIVSLNSKSFSFLKDNEFCGSIIILVSFELSNKPSSKSNSHDLFCFASNCL